MGQAPARAGNVHEHVLQPEPPPDFPHANQTSVRPVLRPSRRKGASPPIRVAPSLFPPAPLPSPPHRGTTGPPALFPCAVAGSFRICSQPKGTRSATSVLPLPANIQVGARAARVPALAPLELPDRFAQNKYAQERRRCPPAA